MCKVHREIQTRRWIQENFGWILLIFVAAGCTSKGQELDVGENSHIQSGSKQKVCLMQIERISAMKEKNPGAVPKINLTTPVLRIDALHVLRAGMAAARALGREKLARLFDVTGKSMAWNTEFQREAMELHAHGKLFGGTRQEDEPYGQEMEPDDLEADEVALPDNAPPKPKLPKHSARDLFILDKRDEVKRDKQFKTFKEADDSLKLDWKDAEKELKDEWEKVKTERKKQYHNELKKWKGTIKALKKSSEADFLSEVGYDPDASSEEEDDEDEDGEEEEEEEEEKEEEA